MSKKIWICEECGREYEKLLFPANCECGNYCEDFFREKDIHDYEDDKLGRPLLGVKYDPMILKERMDNLRKRGVVITQKIDKKDKKASIDFSSMKIIELRKYIKKQDPSIDIKKMKKAELVKTCNIFGNKE